MRAETWACEVLTPWQQTATVTLVVKMPADTATDNHRTVIRNLTDAQQRLDADDWKGSVRASRDARQTTHARRFVARALTGCPAADTAVLSQRAGHQRLRIPLAVTAARSRSPSGAALQRPALRC
ncbi:MAG: hypothetical protein ACLQFR_04820 [Streptosporangiaceae bacterium]